MSEKLPFRTVTSERIEVFSNPGSPIEEIWAMKLDKDGNEEFYVKGKTNVYEKIQMFKDSCDIEKLLIQVTETGDLSLINKTTPFFMDMEDMPENIFEAHQKILEAQNYFYELPLETREAYGNSFDRFLADFGTENWMKNLGLTKKEEIKKEEEVNTTDEQGN